MLLSHLGVLPPAHQVSLFHRLLPLVAALPSATDRTKASAGEDIARNILCATKRFVLEFCSWE